MTELTVDEFLKHKGMYKKVLEDYNLGIIRNLMEDYAVAKHHEQVKNNGVLDPVSFSLPTDDEIEKQANRALFGFGEVRRKYDNDYYTGYQDGSKWIRDKRNES